MAGPVPQPRSAAIDFLRVAGVIAVVVGHVYAAEGVVRATYTWHVPLFFFLTGYLWTTGRDLSDEAGRRFNTLGRPYLFWLVAILVLYAGRMIVENGLDAKVIAKTTYGGYYAVRPFTAFWFVTVLLFVAVAYRLIERLSVPLRVAVVLIGMVVGYVAGPELAESPLSVGSALPCLAFVAAGQVFRLVEPRIRLAIPVGAGLLAIAAVVVASGASGPLDIKAGDYGTPVLGFAVATMVAAGALLIAKPVFARAPAVVNTVVTRLALAGFVVVLTHAVILWLFKTDGSGGVPDLAASLVLPWALGLVLTYTKLSPWAAGVSQQRIVTAGAGTQQVGQ